MWHYKNKPKKNEFYSIKVEQMKNFLQLNKQIKKIAPIASPSTNIFKGGRPHTHHYDRAWFYNLQKENKESSWFLDLL